MKQKIVSVLGIAVVVVLIFVSVKYFRSGSPIISMNNKEDEISRMEETGELSIQDGEPNEVSKKMAKAITDYTKKKWAETQKIFLSEEDMIEPQQIVSTGKEIRKGNFSYKVTSWEITKENPEYPRDENMLGIEYYGLELDEKGNLINGFSYVVVNIEIENLTDEAITEYLWGYLDLKILGADFEATTADCSVLYLGENPPREFTKSYNLETVPANETIKMPLIFIVEDEVLKGKQPYLEINTQGVAGFLKNLRFIILN